MRSSIATYKESLSRIANDVFDATDELAAPEPQPSRESPSPLSDRRRSRRFSQSMSPSTSPIPNGADSTPRSEAEQYRVEIERLHASEVEIKALVFNYAAILKEKEGQLSRLHEENSSLKKTLEAKTSLAQAVTDESIKALINTSGTYRGSNNQSPNRQNRHGIHASPRSLENITHMKANSKQDIVSNGSSQASQLEGSQQNLDLRGPYLSENEKELEILIKEKNNALASLRGDYDSEIKRLREQLQNEREMSANLKLKFQDEQNLKESFRMELDHIKAENKNISAQMKELQKQLGMKLEEVKHLQLETERKSTGEASFESLGKLNDTVATLEKENAKLKAEKEKLDTADKFALEHNQRKVEVDDSEVRSRTSNSVVKEKEEMELRLQQLQKTLKDTYKERDKAQRELARLKQHLLEKELEESDKMDEDSKIIEELRSKYEFQKAHIMKLEMALKREISRQEEIKMIKSNELQKSKEMIDELNQKLENYVNLVEMKNVELLNLQTALGQYYAESEAKERLERELASAREESIQLSDLLKIAKHDLEISEKGKAEVISVLSQTEKMLADAKRTVQKIQDDNSKLHRAVEQSMTRINRMSIDSDFYVDRRIVIKLLVTYFQRNHSKEVLDLMVRMLGFSEEDKKRIGFAQEAAGRTVVRGVLGLPGRLVGGIMGVKQPGFSSESSSDNQSFADLWVDFLLKDAEQKERRELSESDRTTTIAQDKSSNLFDTYSKPATSLPSGSTFSPVHSYTNQYPPTLQKQTVLSDSDSEFANVPLTSSASPATEKSSRFSRLNIRY